MLYEVRIWNAGNPTTLYKAMLTEQEAKEAKKQLHAAGINAFIELSVNLERRQTAGTLK